MCAFLFVSICLSQEADTSITISDFQYTPPEGIPIIFDEVGENTYFLDFYNPVFTSDISIKNIYIDGSLGIPLGNYYFPTILPKKEEQDSIKNVSQINYRKGDYDYHDLGIGLQIENPDSTQFTIQGVRRILPSLYTSNDNELQNYLLSFNSTTEKRSVSTGVLYHLEEYNLPMTNSDNFLRKVESFHGGAALDQEWGIISIQIHPAMQFLQSDHWGNKATNLTLWNKFNSTIQIYSHFNLGINHQFKMISIDFEGQVKEKQYAIFSPHIEGNLEKYYLKSGVAVSDSSFSPIGMVAWHGAPYSISAGRVLKVQLISNGIDEYYPIKYFINSLNIGYNIGTYKVQLEVFNVEDESSSHLGIKGDAIINLPWLHLRGIAGNLDMGNGNSTNLPVEMFSHTSLIFSPNIWRWKQSRYQPFIGAETIYIQHSGRRGVDPADIPVLSSANLAPYSSLLVNTEMGFLVGGFKLSYRWIKFNILEGKIQNGINPDSYPIVPLRHLEVKWQFLN